VHHWKCFACDGLDGQSYLMCISLYVKDTISEHLPNKTMTLHKFCIQYPNVAFIGALEPPFTCQQENQWKIWLVWE